MKKVLLCLLLIYSFVGIAHAQLTDDQVNTLFPTWDDSQSSVGGVLGENTDGHFLVAYVPKIIDLTLMVVAPILVVMFIWSGLRLIYGGNDEEDVKKAKDFLKYSAIGIAFVALAYSIIKALYFVLSGSI